MEIRLVPVETVIPYARNPRKNAGAVGKVAASLREFGFRQPIVVDPEMTVVVGHTRLQAAIQLGMKEVPVHVATGLSAAQIKAYRIADNRTTERYAKTGAPDNSAKSYDAAIATLREKLESAA